MSKNNQDEPDGYEAIFEESYTVKDENGKDYKDEGITPAYDDYIIPDDVNDGSKEDIASLSDDDIEDGIFAPQRPERKPARKSSSLMWAVSLLALVGVGGYVYTSNPDIIRKVTENFNTQSLTNSDVVADVPPEVTPEVTTEMQAVVESVPPAVTSTESAPIADPAVVDNSASLNAPTNLPNEVPVVAPEIPVVAAPNVTTETTVTDVPTETVAPVESKPQAEPPQTLDKPPIEDIKPDIVVAADNKPSEPETKNVSVEAVTPAPKEEPQKTQLNQVEKKVEAAPAASKEDSKEDSKTEIVALSKEEQKRLNDANLDKYFDSPEGKMLKDIPAPSLDPKKGSNESIIIVNKGQKSSQSRRETQDNTIQIETTSLGNQTVAASRALKLGRLDAAKEMYDELYRLNPKDGRILSGRALVLQKMGYEDQAIAAYDELLNLYPDNTDAIVNLAGLIRKQYPAVALNKLLDLHLKHPDNVYVTAQLGVAHADAGNYADASRYLDMAIGMDPHNALHYFNRAVVSDRAGDAAQAIANYEKALEIDAVYGEGQKKISREKVYDRLAQIRGN